MVAPKLRFKEFDGDWSQVKLKDLVLSLDAGVSVNGEDVSVTEDDFSVLKTSCVSLGTFNPDERKKVTLEHEIQRLKEPLLDNSLVMNRSNTPLLVGSSAFIKKAPKKTYLSDKLWQFKVNQNANIQWIAFYFSNETTLTKLRDMATGTSNSMKNITKPDVLNIDLFAPQKAEQTKIASFLSNVDEKISQLTQKHELLSQYKQGMMQKLFSQQLRFKADDGSEFGEWDKVPLDDCVDILTNGLSLDQNTNGNGFQVTRIETISNFNIDLNRVGYVDTQSDISSYKLVIGDILFSNINSISHIGKVVYVDKDYDIYHGMNLLRIQFKRNLDKKFMFYQLSQKKLKQHFESIANKAVNQASINQTALKKTELCTPCLEEQTKIANFLSAIDQKIEVVAQQIEQAKQWKKGLLQQMFV